MSLGRHVSSISLWTGLSRILGFLREILIAQKFGAGGVVDAFFAAFTFPNLFRRVFGEGALNAAFVPLFGKELDRSPQAAEQFAQRTFAFLTVMMALITLLTILFAPIVSFILAAGFRHGEESTKAVVENLSLWELIGSALSKFISGIPVFFHDFGLAILGSFNPKVIAHWDEKFLTTIRLTQICASYSAFICMAALASGVLNTLRSFAIPAFAPVLLNIVCILALIIIGWFGLPIHVLAWAVFFAGFLQLAVVWLACRKQGIHLKPLLTWQRWLGLNTPLMRRLFILMVPGVLAAAAQQIGIVVTRFIASSQDGAQSYLWYGDRVQQLPLGMIGIAMGTVLLPELLRSLKQGRNWEATNLFRQGFSLTTLLTIPAAVAFIIIGPLLFESIFFSPSAKDTPEKALEKIQDIQKSGEVLGLLSLGMPMWVLVKVLLPAYFAREDTKTPLKFSAIAIGVNVVLAAILFHFMKVNGIALASSISGLVNFGLLLWGLRTHQVLSFDTATWRKVAGTLVASLGMGLGLFLAQKALTAYTDAGIWQARLTLAILITFGLSLYFALIYWGKVFTLAELKATMKRQ